MTDQLTPTTLPQETPPCPLCGNPRKWLTRAGRVGAYCGGSQCTSPERICQECGQRFPRGIGEAGTRLCSNRCRNARAVERSRRKTLREPPTCAWCRASVHTYNPRTYDGQPVCNACLGPISHVLRRLRRHHVHISHVFWLLADPTCPICGINVLTPVRQPNGGMLAPLVIDHDHTCCVGDYSCGECVRGLICQTCNFLIGQAHDNPAVLRAAAEYLEDPPDDV